MKESMGSNSQQVQNGGGHTYIKSIFFSFALAHCLLIGNIDVLFPGIVALSIDHWFVQHTAVISKMTSLLYEILFHGIWA